MKKISTLLLLALSILLQSFLLISCDKQLEKYSKYSFDYFDTVTSVIGYTESQEAFDAIAADILAQLGDYHRLFDIYHRYEGLENICTVNELKDGAHRTVTVDESIIDMLIYSKEMYQKTNGKVNIAMGSVLSIWHDYRKAGTSDPLSAQLPPMEKLLEASKHTDIEQLIIDKEKSTVTLLDPEMTLDVGAIAKGYAVEMTARTLEEKGISGFVINVGGNVRSVGLRGDGEKWTAGIENPMEDEDDPYIALLSVSDQSVVTSGSYQRYYIVDGKRYHHIIDPETLMPSDYYQSVSIVCNSSADGDALSTALFCTPLEDGIALVESLPDVEAMWVLADGTVHTSSQFNSYTAE